MKKVLFVCTANVDRSRTAVDFFSEQFDSISFRSAGVDRVLCEAAGSTFLTQEIFDWADRIFVMESVHFDWIHSNLNTQGKHIIVLEIPDHYTYYSMELIELLQQKCSGLFV